LCWIGKTINCPAGYTFAGAQRQCYMFPPICPPGGTFNSTLDKCISSVITDEEPTCGMGVGCKCGKRRGIYIYYRFFS
jgi:hypothetical protein